MVIKCREYLVGKLTTAGVRGNPITSMKKLEASQDSRVAAVLFEGETFDRSGSKKTYIDQSGARHKRRKVFSRDTTFSVIIGDPQPEKTEELFEAFISSLDRGIYIDGNYTPIAVGEAEWVADGDSILRSKVAVNVKVIFSGGVYQDTGFARLSDVEVVEVRKEIPDGEN